MTNQDEEIIEVMARASDRESAAQMGEPDPWTTLPDDCPGQFEIWRRGRFAAAKSALDALRAAGMEVVSRAGIENARNEIETVLDAIRSKPPRNKQEVPVRWIASRLRPAIAMLAAHEAREGLADTAPDGEDE